MHREMYTDTATAPYAQGAANSATARDTRAASTFTAPYSSASAYSASSSNTSAVSNIAAAYAGTAPVNQTGEATFPARRHGKFIR